MTPDGEERKDHLEAKVGLFVLLGLLAMVALLLLLGQKQHVFQKRARIYSVFNDVGGLVAGAPVLISGVNVGMVAAVRFDRSRPLPRIRVELEIARDSLDLVRADSLAHISSQGLLGDKLIDISAGSSGAAPIPPGGLVASAAPPDFDRLLSDAGQVMQNLKKVSEGAAAFTDALSSSGTLEELHGTLSAVHALLDAAVNGSGLAHALFFDPATARALRGILAGVDGLVARVDRAVAALQPIFDSTDKEGRQLINNLAGAARSVGELSTDLHQSKLMPDLERAAADLSQLTGQLRRGEGTLGALLQDPTAYEQLVTILGGVARSRILRALVRYAISRGESQEAKHFKPKTPPPPPPGGAR